MDDNDDSSITSPLPSTITTTTTAAICDPPWLDDTIGIHLHLARTWLQQKAIKKETNPKSNPDREWAGLYFDDGSCLDILSLDASGTLQVVDTNPLTLTDGAATVRVSLAQAIHLTFAFALGHFITLHKYTVRHTAYGPLRDRVTILPESISYSTVAYSVAHTAPKPIHECESVASALQDLQDARFRLDRRCFLSSIDPADETMAAPRHHNDHGSQSSLNTQMSFGTQMPPPSRSRRGGDDELVHTGTRNREPVLAGYTKREELHERTADSDNVKQQQLLRLLPKQPAAANKSPEAARRNSNQVASPASRRASAQPAEGTPRRSQNRPVQSTARKSSTAQSTNSTSSGNEHLDESYVAQIPDGPSLTSSNEDKLDDSEPSWLPLRPVASSAKVHDRQRNLLVREESWHKPRVGLRFPDANIPIEILEALKIKLRSSGEHTTSSINPTQVTMPEEQIESGLEEIDGDIATTQESGQVSWPPTSPVPKPPQSPARNNAGLPPDSSFEAGTNNIGSPANEQNKDIPPSSPPYNPFIQESDDEMELDVPRGLDDKSSVAGSQPTRIVETVQVKETPYTKDKKAPHSKDLSEQIDDDPYKGASSNSVVYCTYNDAQSSADPFAEHTGGDNNDVAMVETTADDAPVQQVKIESPNEQSNFNNEEFLPGDEPNPVQMQDAEDDMSTAIPQTKRKLSHSPSKKSAREVKRRGIKFSSLGPASPPKDIETKLREEKKKSFQNFRDQRRFESAAAQLPQSTRMDTSFETEPDAASQNPVVSGVKQERSPSPYNPGSTERNSTQHTEQVQTFNHAITTPNTSFQTMQDRFEDNMDLYEHPTPDRRRRNDRSRHSSPVDVDDSNNQARGRVQDPHSSPERGQNREEQGPSHATIFQQFKEVYPEYNGDLKHFTNLCKQMITLDMEDKMVPKMQWDDYIIRNKSDYAGYARQCVEDGEEPEPYHRFYKDHVRNTLYTESVIANRQTLALALEEIASFSNPSSSSFSSLHGVQNPSSFKESLPKEPSLNPKRHSLPAQSRVSSSAAMPRTWNSPASNDHAPREPRAISKQINIPSEPRSTSKPSARKNKRRTLPATFTTDTSSTMPNPSASSPLPYRDSHAKDHTGRTPSSTSLNNPKGKQPIRAPSPSSSITPPNPNTNPTPTTSSSTAPPRPRNPRHSQPGSAFARPSSSSTRNAFAPQHHHHHQPPPEPPAAETTPSTTGDIFRDFARAHARVTSWTGSAEIDPRLDWPDNVLVRPSVGDLLDARAEGGRRRYDVLEWGDVL